MGVRVKAIASLKFALFEFKVRPVKHLYQRTLEPSHPKSEPGFLSFIFHRNFVVSETLKSISKATEGPPTSVFNRPEAKANGFSIARLTVRMSNAALLALWLVWNAPFVFAMRANPLDMFIRIIGACFSAFSRYGMKRCATSMVSTTFVVSMKFFGFNVNVSGYHSNQLIPM